MKLDSRRIPKIKHQRFWLGTILAIALCAPSIAGAYTGTLSSGGFGLFGTGNWVVNGPTGIEWDVSQNTDNSWSYVYRFWHPVGETSHFILEASDSFQRSDILSASGDFASYGVGTQTVQSGNPNMPEDIYGIRFNDTWGTVTNIEFRTYRNPVWGDFYAKNGNAGGHGRNTAWNAGFTSNDIDPFAPPSDGSLDYHILVPDTRVSPVPEPASLLLMGVGMLGLGAARRIRNRKA